MPFVELGQYAGRRPVTPHYWQPAAYPYTDEWFSTLISSSGTAMLDEQYADTDYLDEMLALGVAAGTYVRYGVRCAPWGGADANPTVTTGDAAEASYRTGRMQAVKTALTTAGRTLSLIYADTEGWPGTEAATLTTRTSDTVGVLTFANGRTACMTAAATVTLSWTGGTRTTVTGTISDPTIGISGGTGSVLPAQDTIVSITHEAAWYTARTAKYQAFVNICTSEFPGVPVMWYARSGRFSLINSSNVLTGTYSAPNYVSINDPGSFTNTVFYVPDQYKGCAGSLALRGTENTAVAPGNASVFVWLGGKYMHNGSAFGNYDNEYSVTELAKTARWLKTAINPKFVIFYPGPNLSVESGTNALWWTHYNAWMKAWMSAEDETSGAASKMTTAGLSSVGLSFGTL